MIYTDSLYSTIAAQMLFDRTMWNAFDARIRAECQVAEYMNLHETLFLYSQDAASERRRFSLTAAKDRAQLTATTAMSVVHVALLKSIIDAGKDSNRLVPLL